MASKDIDRIRNAFATKGLIVSEWSIRKKLKDIKEDAERLQDTRLVGYLYNLLQEDGEARLVRRVGSLEDRLDSVENELKRVKKEQEETRSELERIRRQLWIYEGHRKRPKIVAGWEEFLAPYPIQLDRYRHIGIFDERHFVNWWGELTEVERCGDMLIELIEMDFDNPNHPRFR